MEQFKGKKLQLAGFRCQQQGTLVDVFAQFCRHDQDPANLPETEYNPFVGRDMPVIHPTISVDEIVEALVGQRDIAPRRRQELDLSGAFTIIADLRPEQLALLLTEMGKARRAFIDQHKTAFIPVSEIK